MVSIGNVTVPRRIGDPKPLQFEGKLITSLSKFISKTETSYEAHIALWDAGDDWRVLIERFTFDDKVRHPADYYVTRFKTCGDLRTDLLLQDCRFDLLDDLIDNVETDQ